MATTTTKKPPQGGSGTAAPAASKEAFKPAKSLAEAVVNIMRECPYIQKTGRMKGGASYSFASEVDLIAALHPLMVKHGLALVPFDGEIAKSEVFPSAGGKLMNRVIVKMRYTLTHAASGETLLVCSFGEGTDIGDKATPKAMTIALKYALRQTFNIEIGDDPDTTSSEVSERIEPGEKNPEEGPMGQSYKNALKAIQGATSGDHLDHIAKRIEFREGRPRNYEEHQLKRLNAAIQERRQVFTRT